MLTQIKKISMEMASEMPILSHLYHKSKQNKTMIVMEMESMTLQIVVLISMAWDHPMDVQTSHKDVERMNLLRQKLQILYKPSYDLLSSIMELPIQRIL